MPKYDDISPDECTEGLRSVVNDAHSEPAQLLDIPGVYEILSEYYNNEVLEFLRPDGDDEEEE